MLLKAGVAMILSSLALAAVVVTVIVLRADSPAEPIFSAEPQAAEVKQTEESKFDPGEKLQIADDELDEEPQPKPQDRETWSAPSPEQSTSGQSPSEST